MSTAHTVNAQAMGISIGEGLASMLSARPLLCYALYLIKYQKLS